MSVESPPLYDGVAPWRADDSGRRLRATHRRTINSQKQVMAVQHDPEDGRRELVLPRARYGYLAKYRWLPEEGTVLILAIRYQLETGYLDE